jgi:hypothetical protein
VEVGICRDPNALAGGPHPVDGPRFPVVGGWRIDSTGHEGGTVKAIKLLGILLIVGGTLGLVYGGFSYTKQTHETKLGPLALTVKDTGRVDIPVWAGVGAIAVGAVLLLLPRRP